MKALCYITGDNPDKFGSLYYWIEYRYKIVTRNKVFFFSENESMYGAMEKARKELYEAGTAHTIVDCLPVYGQTFEWGYFRCKGFKKGSMHFEFIDDNVWGMFNQHIAKIKGYPLFEYKQQTAYQKRQTGRKKEA